MREYLAAKGSERTILLVALLLAVGWIAQSAYFQRASGRQGPGTVRARSVVIVDAADVERGRLTWEADRLVLEAMGEGEESPLQLALHPAEYDPLVTVSSPGGEALVKIVAGVNPWVIMGYEDTERFAFPGLALGVQGHLAPTLQMADAHRLRALLWVMAGTPHLQLYDPEGEVFWHTPEMEVETVWSCPVHEDIQLPGPWKCPICGCELEAVEPVEEPEEEPVDDPDKDADAWMEDGAALEEEGRYGAALRAFERATQAAPEDAEGWHGKARTLLKLQRHEDALRAGERVTEIMPDHVGAWKVRAVALVLLARPEEALAAARRATEIAPDSAGAWTATGGALAVLERHEEALEAYERAAELEPDAADGWVGKGGLFLMLERLDEARQAYERATQVEPDSADAWTGKGTALLMLGRNAEALEAAERALEIAPDHRGARSLRMILRMRLEHPEAEAEGG